MKVTSPLLLFALAAAAVLGADGARCSKGFNTFGASAVLRRLPDYTRAWGSWA